MSSYKGSLRIAATADVIDAVFEVDNDHLTVTTGDEELGSWSLHDLQPDDTGTEVLLALDGERVTVTAIDHIAFSAALVPARSRKRRARHSKPKRSRRREVIAAPDRFSVSPTADEPPPQLQAEPPPQLQAEPQPPPTRSKPQRPTQDKTKHSRPPRDVMGSVRRVLSRDAWQEWAAEGTALWVVASVSVIIVALMAVFATNSLGMILVLLGMVALIIAALAVSEDLSAYSWIPGNLSEVTLVLAGGAAMVLGGLLIVIS